jgi:hypothetical protein
MWLINEPKKLALCIISSLVLALFQPAFFADKSDAFSHTCADQYNNKMNGYV